MTKHRKGSIIGLIGLLIILVAAGFIFFSMISDQIFFKKVNEVEKVQHVNVTLDKAAAKQIDNYTSQQVSNKTIMHGEMHQQVKLKVQWIVVNLSMMINKNINFRFI